MPAITLSQASIIADAALAKGRELDLRALAVVVLDPGGHYVVVKREDEAGLLRVEIANAKAWGTLGMGVGGARFSAHAKRDPVFFSALAAISGGRLASSRGGVIIRDADGAVLGAVGVSGARPEHDEACSLAGIDAAGLLGDTGADPDEG
jgi:uncharacterized protein GlcG (DUF336 family)